MGTTTRYPQSGEPTAVHFDVTSKRPAQEEAARLTSVPIQKKPASGEEVKNALMWFAVGVAIGIVTWFFGNWVIGKFRGPGVLFFGYGAAYIVTPISVIFGINSLLKIFRSAQKTKPEAALKWVYQVSLLGDDAAGTRFGKPEYAVATLARIVPDAIGLDKDAALAYITDVRNTLIQAMELSTAEARSEPPGSWKEGGAQTQLKIDSTQELYPGVSELSATLTYKDTLSWSSSDSKNSVTMITSVLELHIVSVMIRAGKYWYPYDVFPALTCRQELPETVAIEQ